MTELRLRIEHAGSRGVANVEPEKAVLSYGRPFIGVDRPKGYRQRRKQACFGNAATLAFTGRGTYVEGFVTRKDGGLIIPHAWVTLDGEQAIDTTLPDAPEHFYFGIPFPKELVVEWCVRRRNVAYELLDSDDSAELRALMRLLDQQIAGGFRCP
jgi:hypothetical protein